MNRAWSLLWLLVVGCMAFVIIISLIEPYLPAIAILVIIALVVVVVVKLHRSSVSKRRHF